MIICAICMDLFCLETSGTGDCYPIPVKQSLLHLQSKKWMISRRHRQLKRLVDLYLAVPDLSAKHIDHQFTLNPYRLLKVSGRQINLYRTLQFCNLLMFIQKEIEIPVCYLDL